MPRTLDSNVLLDIVNWKKPPVGCPAASPLQLAIRAWLHRSDSNGDFTRVHLNFRPARGRQDQNGDAALREILFMPQVLIGGDENFKSSGFRTRE